MKTHAILVLLLISSIASADMVSYFNNQFIPVEKVDASGSTVTVYYNMDLMMGPTEYKQDIAYIFGTLAREYPNYKEIKIICYAGGEPAFDYTAQTKDIVAYTNDELSESELVSRIGMREHANTPSLDGGILLLLGAGGLILLALATLTLVVVITAVILIKKKKKPK